MDSLLRRRKLLIQKREEILSIASTAEKDQILRSSSSESIIENSDTELSPENPPKRRKITTNFSITNAMLPSGGLDPITDAASSSSSSLITCEDLGFANKDITRPKSDDFLADANETVFSDKNSLLPLTATVTSTATSFDLESIEPLIAVSTSENRPIALESFDSRQLVTISGPTLLYQDLDSTMIVPSLPTSSPTIDSFVILPTELQSLEHRETTSGPTTIHNPIYNPPDITLITIRDLDHDSSAGLPSELTHIRSSKIINKPTTLQDPAKPSADPEELGTREAIALPDTLSENLSTREAIALPATLTTALEELVTREAISLHARSSTAPEELVTRKASSLPAMPPTAPEELVTRKTISLPASPATPSAALEELGTREETSTPATPSTAVEEYGTHEIASTHSALLTAQDSPSLYTTLTTPPIATSNDVEDVFYVIETQVEEENNNLGLARNIEFEIFVEKPTTLATSALTGDAHEFLNTSTIAKPTTHETDSMMDKNTSSTSTAKTKKRKNKKRRICATTEVKRSFLDFVSDEENFIHNEDFSSDSSELWSQKDSESEEMSPNKKKKITKKKKSNKYDKKDKNTESIQIKKQKRENKNKTRKLLRQKGLAYETESGNTKDARKLHENPCLPGKCPRDCFNISEERRKSIFEYFWKLDNEKKKDWILQSVTRMPVKRKKTSAIESRKSYTYEYYINENEGRKQVCQQFIIKTIDVSQKFILYTLGNIEEGLAKKDRRTRTAANTYDDKTKSFAKSFIESLPMLPPHYSRKKSSKLYLPQEYKNTTNLYRIYVKRCDEAKENYLSERLFTNLFKTEYNISFHILKKDKCSFCMKYENNQELTEKDKADKIAHDEETAATYERFIFHQELKTLNTTTLTASFDLQKVLNTPYGESMLLYYSRKYAVYNLTVYESTTENGYCYTWGESDGKRGSCEIGTCIFKYLQDVDKRGVKNLILYCDSCCGQNKNRVMLSVLKYFLGIATSLESIQINFLLPGHTYMPVDSMHAVIEREVKKIIVYSPSQWSNFMESARKRPRPYIVNVMEHHDFIDWEKISDETFTKTTLKNKNLKLRNIRIATFKKKELEKMEVKYSMKEEAEKIQITLSDKGEKEKSTSSGKNKRSMTMKGKGFGKRNKNRKKDNVEDEVGHSSLDQGMQPLYKKRLPISMAKYNDLKKLCTSKIIPDRFHQEYLSLDTSSGIRDALNETDEDDSSCENETIRIQSQND